jgi:deoxyhypusine synthase
MMQRIRDEYEKSERNESTQESARDHAVHEGGMLDRDR